VSVLAAIALLLLQGPYAGGSGLSSALRWEPLSITLGDRFGRLLLVRILALLLAAPLLRGLFAAARGAEATGPPATLSRREGAELAALGLVVAVTLALIGHAGSGDATWLAATSLTLHLVAMSVWLGGLVTLTACLLTRPWGAGDAGDAGAELPPARAAELARVVPAWSRTALASVAVVAATGAFQAWREVGTLPALVDTTYGWLLLCKIWFVVGIVGLGALARRWVLRHYPAGGVDDGGTAGSRRPVTAIGLAGLRRGVLLEALAAAAVLGLTAVLVNTIPARTSYSPPFSDIVSAGPLTVNVHVSPTRRGSETIHVYAYDPQGRAQRLVEASARLSLPSASVGPLEVPLVQAAPGHALAEATQVPLPGEWQLRLTLRVNDFDQYVTTLFYHVR
jgi:copper transport protein